MTEADCITIVSGRNFPVDETHTMKDMEGVERTWWELRPAMILMPAATWVKLKTWIIAECKKYGKCDKSITSWDRSIKIVDDALVEKEILP
jgi:hypothetical protein